MYLGHVLGFIWGVTMFQRYHMTEFPLSNS